jgi:hypothetical protein
MKHLIAPLMFIIVLFVIIGLAVISASHWLH